MDNNSNMASKDMSVNQELLNKLHALKERGIFKAKLPDILVGHLLARVDQSAPDTPTFQLGSLSQFALEGAVEAKWLLVFGEGGGMALFPGGMYPPAFDALISRALDMYNDIIDGLMINADNGLLQ
jgi:hypothetical protein